MCETYRDRIGELNYKTIRYPGHLDHMRFVVNDLGLGDRPDLLARIFDRSIPATTQDVVILYVNALGMRSGKLQQRSYIKKVKAQELFPATAIQTHRRRDGGRDRVVDERSAQARLCAPGGNSVRQLHEDEMGRSRVRLT